MFYKLILISLFTIDLINQVVPKVLEWLGIPITASLRLSLRCKSFRDLLAVCRLHTLYGFSGSQILLTVEHCPDFALAGGLLSPLLPPSQLLPVATTIYPALFVGDCSRRLSLLFGLSSTLQITGGSVLEVRNLIDP